MYCTNCGSEMQNEARFCSHCGAAAPDGPSSGGYTMDSGTPVFQLKPVFIPWVTALSVIPLQLFFTVWGAGFLGGFSTVGIQALQLSIPNWVPFVFFGCLFFFGIPLLTYFAKKKTYGKTVYRFYPSKLDYHEGFFTTEEKSIHYKNVTEVYLRKGIIQKRYGLGTIVLSTPATGLASGGRARSGIMVADVPNPDRNYHQVKDLMKRFA